MRPHFRQRAGSLIIVVVLLLLASALIVFGAQDELSAGLAQARARYDRAALSLGARGGVHLGVAHLARAEPRPDRALVEPNLEDFKRSDRPLGWIVARARRPESDEGYGVESEQGRMPLSRLTTGAINVLFPGELGRGFRDYVASRRGRRPGGGPIEQTEFFRHPFELFAVKGVDRATLMGQDWNDNEVLDEFEKVDRPAKGPGSNNEQPNRGLLDLVTAWGGAFDPYSAKKEVLDIYLSEFAAEAESIRRSVRDRPPLASINPQSPAWLGVAGTMTNLSKIFRVQSFGTRAGTPELKAECVVEYLPEKGVGQGLYRIVHWRQDT